MVTTPLVEEEKRAGEKLLTALDRLHVDVRTALWSYLPEANEWRLFLALPVVDRVGFDHAYRLVQRALPVAQVRIPLRRISVVSMNDPIVQRFRNSAHMQNWDVNGLEYDDAYLYRAA